MKLLIYSYKPTGQAYVPKEKEKGDISPYIYNGKVCPFKSEERKQIIHSKLNYGTSK